MVLLRLVPQEVTGDNFMPLQHCPTSVARTNGTAGQLNLQTRACKARRDRRRPCAPIQCLSLRLLRRSTPSAVEAAA